MERNTAKETLLEALRKHQALSISKYDSLTYRNLSVRENFPLYPHHKAMYQKSSLSGFEQYNYITLDTVISIEPLIHTHGIIKPLYVNSMV